MSSYLPPAVLHACVWTASASFGSGKYGQAKQQRFVLVFSQTPQDGNRWAFSSDQTLAYDGGGDGNGLANVVKCALQPRILAVSQMFVKVLSGDAFVTMATLCQVIRGW
ncbi:hypothetical protein PG985_016450 [Apiospora marii]|uniref:uncharacterized protein n=1 Tax=Apiospora marii TaxID=335849 RepID=UPI003130CA41